MSSEPLNKSAIKAQAQRLGFVACGVAPAAPVEPWYARRYQRRVELGLFADMQYMYNHADMRLNPSLLVPGVRSIVSLALNYMPRRQQKGISLYAQGKDYHEVLRQRVRQLMHELDLHGRCFVDTAPVLERYWAWRSGVGQFCRNGLIAVPGYGPTVFLGELFIEEEMEEYDTPLPLDEAWQKGWQQLCPALTPDGLDARLCISYQTIEQRGQLPQSIRLSSTFYGCDRCLRACPEFRQAQPTGEQAFEPSEALLRMTPEDWNNLSREQYQALFRGSAVKRAKYEGLIRNIERWNKP